MSSGRDSDSEVSKPSDTASESAPDTVVSQALNAELARRFQARAIEMAKEGVFGSLRTRKASLQNGYALLLSLLDNTAVPVLLFGEKGAGKRRHVDELLVVHNFHRKLEGQTPGHLRIFRSIELESGFAAQLAAPQVTAGDVLYLENVDRLDEAGQAELLAHLEARRTLADKGTPQPRLVVGTDRALSILVLRHEFSRELFQVLTSFALFLPSLNERGEDILALTQSLTEELTGKTQTPPAWLVDTLARPLWPGNIDDLKRVLRVAFARKPLMQDWEPGDLPAEVMGAPRTKSFTRASPQDLGHAPVPGDDERKRLQQALLQSGGDRNEAARRSGMTRSEFLQRIFVMGLR